MTKKKKNPKRHLKIPDKKKYDDNKLLNATYKNSLY